MVSLLPFLGGEGPGMRGLAVEIARASGTLSVAWLFGFPPTHALLTG